MDDGCKMPSVGRSLGRAILARARVPHSRTRTHRTTTMSAIFTTSMSAKASAKVRLARLEPARGSVQSLEGLSIRATSNLARSRGVSIVGRRARGHA